MLTCLGLAILLLTLCSCRSLGAVNKHIQNFEYKSTDFSDEWRFKRTASQIGAGALQALLKEAKFLFTNGYDRIFSKSGNYQKASDDFDSVGPTKVKEYKYKGQMRRAGYIGNRRIILERQPGTDNAIMTIKKLPPKNWNTRTDPYVDDIILYE